MREEAIFEAEDTESDEIRKRRKQEIKSEKEEWALVRFYENNEVGSILLADVLFEKLRELSRNTMRVMSIFVILGRIKQVAKRKPRALEIFLKTKL